MPEADRFASNLCSTRTSDRGRVGGAAPPTRRHNRSASGRCAGHRGSSTVLGLGAKDRVAAGVAWLAVAIAGIDLGWSFGRQGAVVELLPDQLQNTWAVHEWMIGAVSTTADRRTRGRILGSDRLATQQESRRSRECLFWVLGQSLPKRTQDRRDQQRTSPWVEPRTVTSRCQPKEPRRGWHRAGTSGLP